MVEKPAEVTAAEIARLAGVGRAAVSNWRRRHADFPRPVGGTDTSPAFSLAAVQDWLRGQGKLVDVPPREQVWQALLGHPDGVARGLALAGGVLPSTVVQLAAVFQLASALPIQVSVPAARVDAAESAATGSRTKALFRFLFFIIFNRV